MSGVGLLVPDLLSEIMLRLPSDINHKFNFAQVSRYWREVALSNHLFWSSFAGKASKADCYRVPMLLQRTGSCTMLHIEFRFIDEADWPAVALNALVPYVARIQTLNIMFWVHSFCSLAPNIVENLLNSNLEFSALQTLCLVGPEYGLAARPLLLLTAPQLRTLDLDHCKPTSLDILLSPSLENIRLNQVDDVNLDTLMDIFVRCPTVWRVVLHSYDYGAYHSHYGDNYFDAFARRRPLARALRELELGTRNPDLGRLLKAGFSDVVLHTLTGCLYNSDIDVLAEALLPGVGPLVFFEILMDQVELRDEDGRIRRFKCWNDDSSFEVGEVWEYLCIHNELHKTVREIRMGEVYWDKYVKAFHLNPPQLQDGITLVFAADWDIDSYQISTDDEKDCTYITKTMRIPWLTKVEFSGDYPHLLLQTVLNVLAHIETACKVEVCIHSRKLLTTDEVQDTLGTLHTTLADDDWVICSQCIAHCIH
ncbi:hypothetical protein B0H19DRAFT_1119117 [Mycena capillaripes]|nr:hypothetical protein B0H19DRAFT_1119117 [Mycena capillaripes]